MKNGYLKLKFKNYVGVAVGLLFIASALVPVEGQPLESTFDPKPPSQVISYFPFIVVLTSILASLFLALKFRNYLGIAVGLLFLAYAFVPMGGYHLEGTMGINCTLWHFMVPTGWYCIAVGVVLLFHRRLGLENRRLAYILFAAGLFIMPLLFRQNVDYWLGLWRGVAGDYDVDAPTWLLTPFLMLAVTGIFTSLLVMITPNRNSEQELSVF